MIERLAFALRHGYFARALQLISELPAEARRRQEAVEGELEMRLGLVPQAKARTLALLAKPGLDASSSARCHVVLGTIARDTGDIPRARSHFEEAVTCLPAGTDVSLSCWARMRLLSLQVSGASREALSGALAILQRDVQNSGDPRLLANLHTCLAEIETRRGLYDTARLHLRSAETLLERHPNVFLQGNLAIAGQCLALLCADWLDARRLGREALQLAEQSGNVRTRLAAHLNLGQGLLSEGKPDLAEPHLIEARRLCPRGGNNEMGLLDALAQTFLAKGKTLQCERLIDQIDELVERQDLGSAYNRYWGLRTKLRLLIHLERWTAAKAIVSRFGRDILMPPDPVLSNALQLAAAEVHVALNERPEAARTIRELSDSLEEMGLENQATYEHLLGRLEFPTSPTAGRQHLERAYRIRRDVQGWQAALTVLDDYGFGSPQDAHEGSPATYQSTGRRAMDLVFDRVGALQRLSGHPRLLGEEAFWLITECSEHARVALVQQERGDAPEQVVLSRPRDHEWMQASGRPLRIDLGRSSTYRLYVSPSGEGTVPILLEIVRGCVARRASQREARTEVPLWTEAVPQRPAGPVVVSASMKTIMDNVKKLAATAIPMLITGETGTGKEVLARFIHEQSPLNTRPFITFNCTSVPPDLLDSQLFGHRRGAFTGADEEFSGLIKAADGGTLFLDEIGDMSRDLQPKLLRFLESSEIQPLGATHPTKVNVRVIAATNAPLATLVEAGRFRADLYYRLNAVRYELPPLRERREEIPALVQLFVRRYSEEFGKHDIKVPAQTMDTLLLCPWPGNIRQLSNEVRRVVALTESRATMTTEHFSPDVIDSQEVTPPAASTANVTVNLNQTLASAVQELERKMLTHALEQTNGRLDAAARLLMVSRKGLYLKRHRLGLDSSHASPRAG